MPQCATMNCGTPATICTCLDVHCGAGRLAVEPKSNSGAVGDCRFHLHTPRNSRRTVRPPMRCTDPSFATSRRASCRPFANPSVAPTMPTTICGRCCPCALPFSRRSCSSSAADSTPSRRSDSTRIGRRKVEPVLAARQPNGEPPIWRTTWPLARCLSC